MRVLTVTAVPPERDAVLLAAPGRAPGGTGALVLDVLAAGVGPAAAAAGTATALTTAELAGRPYGLVVSAGIGGGFLAPVEHPSGGGPVRSPLRLGQVAVATEIVAADLGAHTAEGFVSVDELGFGTAVHRPPEALARAVSRATGGVEGPVLTVSSVTGTAERAAELAARHPGAVAEAMEGFGVAQAAAEHGIAVLEVRTLSNAVGPRDRAAWKIPEALRALTEAFRQLLPVLDDWNEHD